MKFFSSLFGGGAEKHEDKGDELRLDFEYREAAFKYQQALEALDEEEGEAAERLKRKLREVRRQALEQLLEEADELLESDAAELAFEKLEIAANFADDEAGRTEVARRQEALSEQARTRMPEPEVESPDLVSGTEGDLFELALAAWDPDDRERAEALGEPFRLAYEACQKEEWAAGLEQLTALIEAHGDDPLLLELAGLAAENAGKNEQALDLFLRARTLQPGRAAAVQGLVSAYRRLGRSAEARQALAEAVQAHPLDSEISPAWTELHAEYALALSEDGHHEDAAAVFLALLRMPGADTASLLFNLGGVLERAGREEDALAALERAVEAAPRTAIYRERLADFLVKRGQELDRALRLLIEANEVETTAAAGMLGGGGTTVTISPNRPRYLYKIARIYFLKGEDLEAEKTVTTALHLSKDPEVTEALETLRKELKEVRQSP